jgi:hypothetical protein
MKAILVCQGKGMKSVVAVVMAEDAQHDAVVARLRASDPQGEWFTTRTFTVESAADVVAYFANEQLTAADRVCVDCGEHFDMDASDADMKSEYCSSDCQRHDELAQASRG